MSQPSYSDLLEEAASRGATPEQARLCAGRGTKMPEEEPECTHDELDHGICLHCGEDRDMNSHCYGKKP